VALGSPGTEPRLFSSGEQGGFLSCVTLFYALFALNFTKPR